MVRIRQMRLVSYVAALLLVAMYVAPAASVAKGGSKPPPPPAKTIIVFPFEDATQSPIEALSNDLANSIQTGLSASGAYRAFAFSERLPSVQRAVMETTLKPGDLKGPFGTEKGQIASALKVARETAVDMMLVGSIDDIKADVPKKKAQVTLTVVVADGRTGEPVKTVSVTGVTPDNTQSTNESDLIAQAAGDAVSKVVKEIAPAGQAQQATTTAPVVKKKKSGIRKLLIPLLLGLAVGLIATSNSNSGDNGSIDVPPVGPF